MSKKKICFIAQFPPPIHGLSKAVDTLYTSEINADTHPDGAFLFEKIDITSNRQILSNLRKIRKSRADLFYFTISQTKGGNLRDLVILKLLSLQHKKCLVHLHGGYYRQLVEHDMPAWQKKANYRAVKKLAGAIVLSASLKDIFRGMLAEEKIHVVENCVDDQYLLSEPEIEEKLQNLQHKNVLHMMWLSNFIRTKGYPEVLALAAMEKARVDAGGEQRFHFDFAGKFFDSAEETYFQEYVRSHELAPYITYHGVVSGEKKRDLLKQCDLFALPTRYPNEGQPISILEAMGNAMYVVTTDHAGIPDIVQNDVNGIVADKNMTTDKIYEKLYAFTNEELAAINRRNRAYCKARFSENVYISNMKELFLHI